MKNKAAVTFSGKTLTGILTPVTSKSECNRVLIIHFLSGNRILPYNLSDCDDTRILKENLEKIKQAKDTVTLHCGHGGTVIRFLLALCAVTPGRYILTGSERLCQRPLRELVTALRQCGADVQYMQHEGFAPLMINGKKVTGGEITLPAHISSQYISALLLCAPAFEKGISLSLTGKQVSQPYITLTCSIMKYYGITVSDNQNILSVQPGSYIHRAYSPESDWSAASYFYSMAALAPHASIRLLGYRKNSLQPDSVLPELYRVFGIDTEFSEEGIHLTRNEKSVPRKFEYDFTHCPDIAQTVAVTCAALGTEALLTGLDTLRNKESDRIFDFCAELKKINVLPPVASGNAIHIPSSAMQPGDVCIQTCNDHRMAMSFAPLAMRKNTVYIHNPGVVKKSYPRFWDDLRILGLQIECL